MTFNSDPMKKITLRDNDHIPTIIQIVTAIIIKFTRKQPKP